MTYQILILTLTSTFLVFNSQVKEQPPSQIKKAEMSPPVQTGEWIDIFDGKSFDGWHGYNKDEVGPAWQIEDGAMVLDKSKGKAGDIISDEAYQNFELTLEWKISECGNSGIFFNVVESPKYHSPWLTGPEMQILDNSCHPDAKIETHRAGDLYDMIQTSVVNVKPAGEWNKINIRSLDNEVTFWQNDEQVVQFTMHDESWDKMVSESKFKSMPDFGKARGGKIGLQDHGDKVWFRNIRIKKL